MQPSQATPIAGARDIETIEQTDYATWVGARSTYELLRQAAEARPQAPAIVYVHDPTDPGSTLVWTHAELLDRVHRAAALLRGLGIRRDAPVALLVPHTPSAQVALWAAQLAGCAFPINFLLNAEHVAQLLRAAGARVIVALGPAQGLPVHDTVDRAVKLAGGIEQVLWLDSNELGPAEGSFQSRLMAQAPDWPDHDRPVTTDLAALYHTGGTTGLPKLLQHTHANELHTSRSAPAFYDFRAGDRILNGFPLFHVAGAFVYGLSCLAAGGSVFIPTLTGFRNPGFVHTAWQWLDRCKVTHLGCVPTALAALLTAARGAGEASHVRLALTGGSPLAPELASRFERRTGVPVRSIFGMTECAGIVSIEPVHAPRTPNSVGLRLPYTRVVAVPLEDANASRVSRELPAGETGVLALRGPHVSPGYVDASKNVGTFTEDGWLLSGDLGHVDEAGRIFITGRAKDLIIRSSHNIDPGMIEDAFLAHPAVLACAAVGEPDAFAGELPIAFVSLKPGQDISPETLLREVVPGIPEPPAVPKRVVVLGELPMTPIGKIFKPALRTAAAEQKVRALLSDAVPGLDCVVTAEERGGRTVLRVRLQAGVAAGDRSRLRRAVAELPVAVEFE